MPEPLYLNANGEVVGTDATDSEIAEVVSALTLRKVFSFSLTHLLRRIKMVNMPTMGLVGST